MSLLADLYPWTKSLHVIAMVAWMAGLFYLPRIYVYHAENPDAPARTHVIFKTMERKLLRYIMNPAMIATWVFGLVLLATPGVVDFGAGWIWIKLAAVGGLSWFHMWLAARRRDFAADANRLGGRRYRIMNEVPTLALVVIVIMVIVRPF